MGKIILVQPCGLNWEAGQRDMSRLANIMPPIGLCSLASWLEKHGHQALICDLYAFPEDETRLMDTVRTEKPSFVGFSATTSSFLEAVQLAEKIKEAHPGVKTIFGGVHVSALGGELMRNFRVMDYAVAGEGENALLDLMNREGKPPFSAGGIFYRQDGEVSWSGKGTQIDDLDRLPFPAYDKLKGFPRQYKLPLFSFPKSPATIAVTSRGCLFSCTYCDRSVFGRTYRYHSPAYLIDWFSDLNKRFGIRHLNLYDDNLTLNGERVVELCEALIRAGLPLSFNCASRPERLNRDLLRIMKRAGCWMISLGIESGDAELLQRHRSHPADLDLIRERVHLIRSMGIRVKGLFMLGLPGETQESIQRTRDFILSLPLDDFNLTLFAPFPGAACYKDLNRHGVFTEKWELTNCLNVLFTPKGLTAEELDAHFKGIYRAYYKRFGVLFRYVTLAGRSGDSWIRFLRHLGSFLALRKHYRAGRSR
ncbi:MAG: B12-binding domain-containing radical SAM protein [Candidatus Aminicenantes bacterium RBG_13_62_12]|nr:MAG: B12-binding domain-containing radical SAM protein [Candidatus Aminicenantes bacterium RBG_13_62_12]